MEVGGGRNPQWERQGLALGDTLCLEDEGSGHRLRVQTVPLFNEMQTGSLVQTIQRQWDTVWTRT